ncbi:energy-converting hydrogenase A, subunit K [Methanothermobacter sp. K4]|uniref:energy-converting hydrogenase A, subunit K n=1 Tax=Methanothermobacter sp. K4 TaxID=2913262 RepID=UPI001EDB5C87|nr:energy-converting hydrogenase A, subunit K [Methanothermobacter sp. K4]MCG2828404.1 energy-converting hydrogenase A, subunit K [Methanothermobacter sp. K4]
MEKGLTVLTALVAGGVIIVSMLAAILQRISVIPVTVLAAIFVVLLLMSGSERFSELSEELERVAFFAALALFIISFLVLYRPV